MDAEGSVEHVRNPGIVEREFSRCESCGKAMMIREYPDGSYLHEWPLCPHGFSTRSKGNAYTGRTIWTGQEVYGKKYGSDEWKADTVASMLKDQLTPRQMIESMREEGLS